MSSKTLLFVKYKQGDDLALNRLLDIERVTFYNYLIRMTGEISRSYDSMEEIITTLINSENNAATLNEFRIELYRTGRKFNADIWNINTNKLRNPLNVENKDSSSDYMLDETIQELPKGQREAIILNILCKFPLDNTAEIMGVGIEEIENLLVAGLQTIDAKCSKINNPETRIENLPKHEPPMHSINATVDLGLLVKGMKTPTFGNLFAKVILILVCIAAVILFLYPELITKLQTQIESLISHGIGQ